MQTETKSKLMEITIQNGWYNFHLWEIPNNQPDLIHVDLLWSCSGFQQDHDCCWHVTKLRDTAHWREPTKKLILFQLINTNDFINIELGKITILHWSIHCLFWFGSKHGSIWVTT